MIVTPTSAVCGAVVTGVDLTKDLSQDLIDDIRGHWLENKVLVFPEQKLTGHDLERFTRCFGDLGQDPFFKPIDGYKNICAIQRAAEERTPIFAEWFHSDWSFETNPPPGTVLYGITIPPHGGNTLFADQVAAYENLPADLAAQVDDLIAIHSPELSYASDGAYGDNENEQGRTMQVIIDDDKARVRQEHPLVITHPETGKRTFFSSIAYMLGLVGMEQEEGMQFLMKLYEHQTRDEFIYSHRWQKDMLVMWDNRSVLHAATGGYDGYDRLLHRLTVWDNAVA